MVKRKRELEAHPPIDVVTDVAKSKVAKTNDHIDVKVPVLMIQIVAGSYERVLHGITASVSRISSEEPTVQFADSFLFNAHASSIRCLAISPVSQQENLEDQGVYLATGGSDEKINIYSLSATPMPENDKIPSIPTIGNNQISENPGNRELGTLVQHSSNVTALHFPTRSKLLSASEDNTISISKTRDLAVVTTIKAPRPKAVGQPSGDTAPVGATPAGVNDFAVHPSMKLMVSVGRGERCMRLWNLVTGKKAGVLNFDKNVLTSIKESRYSSGEGKRIRWNPTGTEFAVAFERGVIIFEDAKPRCVVLPQPMTKVHQISYLTLESKNSLLAISTEDGRIIFYDTSIIVSTGTEKNTPGAVKCVAQLGGRASGVSGRIKDFKILPVKVNGNDAESYMAVTAGSDGTVKIWQIKLSDLDSSTPADKIRQIGILIGSYETGNRITCLDAFVMLPGNSETGNLSEFEGLTEGEEEETEVESDDE